MENPFVARAAWTRKRRRVSVQGVHDRVQLSIELVPRGRIDVDH